VLLQARERANLTQLELATLAAVGARDGNRSPDSDRPAEQARRIRTWESRIGAWERGIDQPSAQAVPVFARLLGIPPLALFDVNPSSPPVTALRFAAGLTLQALADTTGLSYTSLHRMLRGVTQMPNETAGRLAEALGVTTDELLASIARER